MSTIKLFCFAIRIFINCFSVICLKSVSQHDTAVSSQKRPKSVLDTDNPYQADTPKFRGGNPYFFSENLYQSVSFIYASMYSENVHAIQIAMQFTQNRGIV